MVKEMAGEGTCASVSPFPQESMGVRRKAEVERDEDTSKRPL